MKYEAARYKDEEVARMVLDRLEGRPFRDEDCRIHVEHGWVILKGTVGSAPTPAATPATTQPSEAWPTRVAIAAPTPRPDLQPTRAAIAAPGPTQFVTTDASGNLGTLPLSSLGLASTTDVVASVNQLNRRISKTNTGVAMAFAMAGVPALLSTEKFAFSTSWGTFQGENGAALSAAVRIYRNVQLQGSFAYGFRENMAGGHAGLRFGF